MLKALALNQTVIPKQESPGTAQGKQLQEECLLGRHYHADSVLCLQGLKNLLHPTLLVNMKVDMV